MLEYKYPGVYLEEISSGVRPIEGVGTSTAAFIGFTGPSGTIDEKPKIVHNWNDYLNNFPTTPGSMFALAVYTYFLNGGRKAYIIRLNKDAVAASYNPTKGTIPILTVQAKNDGVAGNNIQVSITEIEGVQHQFAISFKREDGSSDPESYIVSLNNRSADYCFTKINSKSSLINIAYHPQISTTLNDQLLNGKWTGATIDNTSQIIQPKPVDEKWELTLNIDYLGDRKVEIEVPTGGVNIDQFCDLLQKEVSQLGQYDGYQNFTALLNDRKVELVSGSGKASCSSVDFISGNIGELLNLKGDGWSRQFGTMNLIPDKFSWKNLDNGNDAAQPTTTNYIDAFEQLKNYPDVNIIVLPERTYKSDSDKAVISKARSYCENTKSCMVIVDPPEDMDYSTDNTNSLISEKSSYVTYYFPWLETFDPISNNSATIKVPPSSFAAAIWARTDVQRGVWKAPAGMETGLLGIAGPTRQITNQEQGPLNDAGINIIRKINGSNVIWGARTLSTQTDPEWKYISVRRTAIYIEQSIFNGIQWAVFEPNCEQLWSSLRLNIESFLNGMFRAGAFAGKTSRDSYYVRCGLNDTMTQADIDLGRVIVLVGFAALKPAEFVIVRIQQIAGQH